MSAMRSASWQGAGVGVGGVAQPGAVLEHADPGGGEEAHLRGELAGLLAAVVEVLGEGGVEEDDGLADGHAVLGAAEAEDVDAGLPGGVGGGAAEAGAGVGEAGAVHVEAEAELAADGGDGADLVEGVDLAGLGGLGDGDDAGLGEVDVAAAGGDGADGVGGELAVGGGGDEELGAVGEELGGAALVGLDVGAVGADDAVVALAEGGEGEGVGGGAVEGEEDLAAGVEEGAEGVGGLAVQASPP